MARTASDETLRIEGMALKRGTREHKRMPVAEQADGSWVELPVIVLRGAGGKAFASGTDIAQFKAFTSREDGLAYERGRDDMSSSKERPGAVHHRTGETCPVCGDTVREVAYVKYTVNYCATCQTGGKVLADNTTSKFLK